QLNGLRNTQINLAQSALLLRDQLVDLEYRILDTQKTHDRYTALYKEDETSAISRENFERVRDELAYMRKKRELLIERIAQEERLSELQLEQADWSIERLNLSLDLVSKVLDSLEVRAPISGYLSSINAELGQNINRGQRIGQIDVLDGYEIRADIDQY